MLNKVSKNNKVSSHSVILVGIGASAGGLEALRDLIYLLPESDCLSYVITQHVSPSHVSMLINLLAQLTSLQVRNLKKKQKPQPGFLYITPPNNDVVLEKGQLMLVRPQHTIGPKPSINRFFFSLADELKEHAIGIILSGTGTDGASGISSIKASGGITIAQDPDTAKYDGMPKAAINTGNIDLILPCSEIVSALTRLVNHSEEFYEESTVDQKPDDYNQIYSLVKKILLSNSMLIKKILLNDALRAACVFWVLVHSRRISSISKTIGKNPGYWSVICLSA